MNATDDFETTSVDWEPFPADWQPMGPWRFAGFLLLHFAYGGCAIVGFLWLIRLITGGLA